MAKRGKFIVFEGGEGSGKDTQIEFLKKDMPEALFTKEPGGTKLGVELRRVLLDWRDGQIDPLSELFLFSASRVHFIKDVVRPALERGQDVVSNRFALSTLAYQVYGREKPELLDFARSAIAMSIGDTIPDFTVLIDIDPAIGLDRVLQRGDGQTKFDAESKAFHERVRKGYLKHVGDFGANVVIDGGKSVEEVRKEIQETILKALSLRP